MVYMGRSFVISVLVAFNISVLEQTSLALPQTVKTNPQINISPNVPAVFFRDSSHLTMESYQAMLHAYRLINPHSNANVAIVTNGSFPTCLADLVQLVWSILKQNLRPLQITVLPLNGTYLLLSFLKLNEINSQLLKKYTFAINLIAVSSSEIINAQPNNIVRAGLAMPSTNIHIYITRRESLRN